MTRADASTPAGADDPAPGAPRTVMSATDVARALRRIAHEVLEHNRGTDNLLLLGIPTRGVELSRRLAAILHEVEGTEVPVGELDITMFRDDLRHQPTRAPMPTLIPTGGSTTGSSSSSTTSCTRAAPSGPRSTPSPTSAGPAPSGSPCSSTAATASCRSAPTTSGRTSRPRTERVMVRLRGRDDVATSVPIAAGETRAGAGRHAMKHLLSSADLSRDDVRMLLATATEMHEVQRRDVKKLPTLRGRTVINLFFEDSTRTRSSFEIAGKWMCADTINITGKGSSASKGESLRDTVRTLDAMWVDGLVIRHMASGAAHQVAQWVDASVVNAGDGTHEHPTQALLDAYTMEQRLGGLEGARVVIVGDLTHSRVFRSNAITLRTLGAHVTLVAPPTLMPSGIGPWASADGLEPTDDLDAVLASGPDAVMMLRVQRERMSGGFFPTPASTPWASASPASACGPCPTPTRRPSSATPVR